MADIMNSQMFDGNTPLHLAAGLAIPAEDDHIQLIRLLLAFGADATKKNQNNGSPKDNVYQRRQKVRDAKKMARKCLL